MDYVWRYLNEASPTETHQRVIERFHWVSLKKLVKLGFVDVRSVKHQTFVHLKVLPLLCPGGFLPKFEFRITYILRMF